MKTYYEKKLGKVPAEIKKVKLSQKSSDILSGKHDNDPIDAKCFPVIAKLLERIGKGHLVINKQLNQI